MSNNKNAKSEKRSEPEMDLIPREQKDIIIYDLDNIDKIYKDIIEINQKIQFFKKTSISGSPLEIIKEDKRTYNLKDEMNYNKIKRILNIPNGDTFKGNVEINTENKNLSLKNGIYTWTTGETYVGDFNINNQFEGNGVLEKKGKNESYYLFSNFKDGYPGNKSIFKIKENNGIEIYIESDIKKEEKKGQIYLQFNGRTNITKSVYGKEIYRFDGELENGIIKDHASIQRKFKNSRDIDIYIKSKKEGNDLTYMDIEIITINANKKFYYKGKYLNGLRIDKYTIQDEENSIYKNEITKKSEIGNIFSDLNTALLTITGKECFEKLYRHGLNSLKLFNRLYNTKIDEKILVCHINQKTINSIGLSSFCSSNFLNLKELALNECGLSDITPLEKANIPKLESLSLGKNKISMISSLNNFPFSKLQIIMLGCNIISDIISLNKFKSTKLKTLTLLDNDISDISPLTKLSTPNLEIISLGNSISNICVLSKCYFPKLKQLGLQNNKIKDISSIKDFYFPRLEVLYLSKNEISDISVFKFCNFPILNVLSLDSNKIKNIKPLLSMPNLKMKTIKKLNISHNKFRPNVGNNRTIIENLQKYIEVVQV